MNNVVLVNWDILYYLIGQNNYLHINLLTYIPTHLPFYKPTYLSTLYFPPTILHPYLPTYLLTYLPTSFPPIIFTYLPTYLPIYLLLPTYHRTSLHTHVNLKKCSPLVRTWVIIGEVKGSIPNICNLSPQEIMVYLIEKLNQKPIILTFGQFDHVVILDKSIWTHPIWLMVFLTNHKIIFLTNQIEQKFGQPKKINLKNTQFVNIKM
jgi:hypothetical protein